MSDAGIYRHVRSGRSLLRSLACAGWFGLAEKRLHISAEGQFHLGFCIFKAASLNIDGALLAAALPPVIREPELAFNA